MKNITCELYYDFKKNETKIGKKIFNIFNLDLCSIIVTDNVWWVEKTSVYNYIPNYFIEYLRKYLKRKYKLNYLYDSLKKESEEK